MPATKLAITFLVAVMVRLSTIAATDVRSSLTSATNGGILTVTVGGIAVVVAVLVAVKTWKAGRPKNVELHEVIISPNRPAGERSYTKKHFVYTAHI
uniref:RxLR effector candidate protein n=1 Tax=Hyaloperonospora arabidopsidis (strain Emoy2) TaxID=559515 RepID=M4BU49_HYAAE